MKVSIITIAYNNLRGLKDTYESIRRQTFKDYEWIVVDGGSTDGSRRFLEEHDSEIAFWCSEPDKGVYNAQNKGTLHAGGEYCIYMNSGDTFFADDVLEKVFEKDIEADIIYGNWMLIFENGKTRKGIVPDKADMAYFFDNNMCHQSMFIRTEAVRERPYDESFHIYADWEEWLALLTQGRTFEKIDMIVCNFMVGGLSTGDNASEKLKQERKAEIKRINERYYPEPWKSALKRVASIVRAAGEHEYLVRKRKQHNRIIRMLIIVSILLLLTNVATLLYVLLK
ncbi:MAG: glycosyltransferase [Prevotella sp.]|nr:glycosyltransferase [Prevotella sp.]MBP3712357.1 glycosyltransferase [Bacteroidaceae bacterium]